MIVYQVMRRKTRFVKVRGKGRKGTICYQRDKPERDQKCVRTVGKRGYNLMDEGGKSWLEWSEEEEEKEEEDGGRVRYRREQDETQEPVRRSGLELLRKGNVL